MNIKTRTAKIEDLEILKEFEQELIKYERPFASNLREDPISYYDIDKLIENKDSQVIVATIDEKIVGSGYALIKQSVTYKKPDQYAYLGFMYVAPAYRGKGINGIVMEELLKWCKTNDLTEIQLDVYAENESAVKAYEKIGFKPDLLKMRLETKE